MALLGQNTRNAKSIGHKRKAGLPPFQNSLSSRNWQTFHNLLHEKFLSLLKRKKENLKNNSQAETRGKGISESKMKSTSANCFK